MTDKMLRTRAAGRSAGLWRGTRGVTVVPTAEGPSLRSDPRWTAAGAARAARLLDRLTRRRPRVGTGP